MQKISVLHPRDTAYFDEATLSGLSRDLGSSVAENILCRALEDIAARFAQIRQDYSNGDHPALRNRSTQLFPSLTKSAFLDWRGSVLMLSTVSIKPIRSPWPPRFVASCVGAKWRCLLQTKAPTSTSDSACSACASAYLRFIVQGDIHDRRSRACGH